MGNRLSKIVTRSGDEGFTGLAEGQRLPKNHPRIHCLGEVDELNACIGLVDSLLPTAEMKALLGSIQHDLFDLGAELCQPDRCLIDQRYIQFLDMEIDSLAADLPALKEFILPAGSQLIASIHVTRTVCRRAERSLVELQQHEVVNPLSLIYLNRLSDLFFILARYIAKQNNQAEVYWQSQYSRVQPS